MIIKKLKAFNLTEMVITTAIMGIIGTISIPQLMPMLSEFSVKENILTTEQLIKEARSYAIKKSSTMYIDFSQASTATSTQGGLIEIKNASSNEIIKSTYLDQNIIYNSTKSTIENSKIYFDYKGRPIDSYGEFSEFYEGNNSVAISNTGSKTIVKRLYVSPITGQVSIE